MQTRERVFQDNLKVYVNSKHFVEFHVVFFSCSIGGSRDTYQYLESKFRLTMQEDYCAAILEPNKSLGSADVTFFRRFGDGKRKTSPQRARAAGEGLHRPYLQIRLNSRECLHQVLYTQGVYFLFIL